MKRDAAFPLVPAGDSPIRRSRPRQMASQLTDAPAEQRPGLEFYASAAVKIQYTDAIPREAPLAESQFLSPTAAPKPLY